MPTIRKSKKYILCGENGFRVTYKVYGYVSGESQPSTKDVTVWVPTRGQAEKITDHPKLPNRIPTMILEVLKVSMPTAYEQYIQQMDDAIRLTNKVISENARIVNGG